VLALTMRWAGVDVSGVSDGEVYGVNSVSHWDQHNLAEIEEVLPHVRFPQVSDGALSAVERSALHAASPVLRALAAEARLVHLSRSFGAGEFAAAAGAAADVAAGAAAGTAADICLMPGAMAVARDGSSVSLAAADRRAAARREPRACFGANLVYLRDGDRNGVCRYIGSKARAYTRPRFSST